MGIIVPFTVCHGQSQASGSNSTTTPKGKLELKSYPKKHRAPSNVFLEYEYTGEGFFLYPSEPYESVTLTVEDVTCASSWSDTLSESNGYFLETGPLHGKYTITAVTDNNVTFYGEIEIF